MKPTAAAVITKNRTASRLRTLPRIKARSLPRARHSSFAEAVADAAHREQVLRGARIALQLLAEVTNVDVDGAGIPVGRVAPDLLQQHLARLHPPGRAREGGQDLELDIGQLHPLAPGRHHAPLEVDLQ